MSVTRILIIRLSSLGDIIHTYPMLNDIKQNNPDAEIDWLVDKSFVELLELNPLIDNIISIPLRKWKKDKLNFISNAYKWYKQIDKKEYDYIIDSQGLLKSALLTKLFKGKKFGLGINSIKEKLATKFYDIPVETGRDILAIQKNRILASLIFDYKLPELNFGLDNIVIKEDKIYARNSYVVFFHATSKDSKKYPADKWAELAKYLINNYNYKIVLPYGSDKELQESQQISQLIANDGVIIPDKIYSYKQLASIIVDAKFIFGVDTGLIHLANALNKNLLAIYTDTDPNKTGIYETNKAKNIGGVNQSPSIKELIDNFNQLKNL